jgi:hypothetical protein
MKPLFEVTYSEGEWQALIARVENLQKEITELKYDLLKWARKGQ